MNKHRTLSFMAWVTLLIFASIAVSWEVGKRQGWPDKIDNGAVRHSAGKVLEKL
jgi:hypothetical protein